MKKVISLLAVFGALAAVGCGDDDDGGAKSAEQCKSAPSALTCTYIDVCCSGSESCWYNAEKGADTKRFDCEGSDCQGAAQQATAWCNSL